MPKEITDKKESIIIYDDLITNKQKKSIENKKITVDIKMADICIVNELNPCDEIQQSAIKNNVPICDYKLLEDKDFVFLCS